MAENIEDEEQLRKDLEKTTSGFFDDGKTQAEEALKFNFTPTTTSDEELSSFGRRQAAGVAADKGTVAGKQARAAARQAGGSRLFAAIQGAQAANDASAQGFSDEANTARAMKMQREQAANELAFNKASQEYQTEAQKRAAEVQRKHDEAMAEANRKWQENENQKDRDTQKALSDATISAQRDQNIWSMITSALTSWF